MFASLSIGGAVLVICLALAAVFLWPGPGIRRELGKRRELHARALLEDLLKHILTRRYEGREASVESAAGQLKLPAQTVHRLIVRTESAGLVRFEAGRLQLTAEGERWALQVIRAHRLWETWLANEARMPMVEVHKSAERAEHKFTSQQIDELDAYLGHPRRDPHGDPIPTASGEIAPLDARPLTEWPENTPAQIAHVEDEPVAVFRTITDLGLRPGSVIEIRRRSPDQFTITDGERDHTLAPLIAGNIQVIQPVQTGAGLESLARLSDLESGEEGEVALLDQELRGFTRRRLLDLGLTAGSRVTAHLTNAFGDPLAYRVRGTTIALRKEQASKIWIKKRASAGKEARAL
jgi:DtxR family transcriptional regulator, Mn-dependent transcriptional regulator